MPAKMTHTKAFAHFGTKPRNVQWSWSAISDDGNTVVATLWQDKFVRKNGHTIYDEKGLVPTPEGKPGFKELRDNLALAQDNCGGLIHVIIAIAKDTEASP